MLDGFGISGYRSFGEEVQYFGPLSKFNLVIGQNNCGKSNVLLYVKDILPKAIMSTRGLGGTFSLNSLEKSLSQKSGLFRMAMGIKKNSSLNNEIIKKLGDSIPPRIGDIITRILDSVAQNNDDGMGWITFEGSWDHRLEIKKELIDRLLLKKSVNDQDWEFIWRIITNQNGGSLKQHWIPETLKKIFIELVELPPTIIVPAIRKIGDTGTDIENDYSGNGIIVKLAMLQNPSHDMQNQKAVFGKINNFLQEVTGIHDATIEIPYKRDTILVHANGRTLPLINLGTGIHEVIILASIATSISSNIVCIEEPELHLHPTLQKKLAKYLIENTNNQYIISTHSASLMDIEGASIFHVSLINGDSYISGVVSSKNKYFVCTDLGYRASDLMQANCIIWVEGPSDRIYINNWISSIDSSFTEGLHYSIMFYGGRLLSHLSSNDLDIDDFISLRKLNRNLVIVIDSDKKKNSDNINETKARILSETIKGNGFCWITAGREIENYIDQSVLEMAIKTSHSKVDYIKAGKQYDDSLRCYTADGKQFEYYDKVRIAKTAASSPLMLDILDLKEMVTRLVDEIRKANGLV